MLQALKVDPGPRPAAPREQDNGTELLNQAFAGYLASAANFAGLASQAQAPPAQAPRPESTPAAKEGRPAALRTAPRPNPKEAEADRPAPAKAPEPDQPAAAKPRKADGPEKSPDDRTTPEAKVAGTDTNTPEKPAAVPASDAAAKASASDPAPSASVSPENPFLPFQVARNPEAPTRSATPEIKGLAGASATLPAATQDAASAKPQAAPEPITPSAQLHFHFSDGAPEATSKPALTELLSIPKPEIETPKPVQTASRLEPAPIKDVANLALSTVKVSDPAFVSPASPAILTQAREAGPSLLARTDPQPIKASGTSSIVPGAAGPAAMVKGTTPVPSLESPQGAKANATFTQMDGTIRWLLKNQEKGAEIQLNPESLGRVVIKLRVEGSEVHARLWASEASTVPLLQDQRAALEASLRQQGLNLGSFNLQQGRRGDDAQQAAQSQGTVSGPGIAEPLQGKQDLPSLSPAALGGAHLIEILA